jgi:magnesium-transporting ATPase (P-type)
MMNNSRDIIIGAKNTAFNSNKLNNNKNCLLIEPFKTTKKYFSNLENIYFLIISIFQLLTISILPQNWSPTGPYSTSIPLLLCLIMDIIVDCLKWINTYRDDCIKNNTIYNIWDFKTKKWINKKNMNIYPGDIIALQTNMVIPMDILLIDYNSKDFCKLSLSNLNGESNLITIMKVSNKYKLEDFVFSKISIINNNKNSIFDIDGNITFENGDNINWDSRMFMVNGSKMISEGGIGVVLSCASDLKLINSQPEDYECNKTNSSMNKISNFMMNTTIYILITIVVTITLTKSHYYIKNNINNINNIEIIGFFILNIVQNWIVLNGLIPFSIKILLNSIKHFQSKKLLSHHNIKMNTPYLVDQFSSIEYVLSDKTGTITKNSLELMTLVDFDNNIYNLEETTRLIPKDILRAIGLSIGFDEGEYCTPEDKTIHQRYIYLNSQIEYINDEIRLNLYGNIENHTRIKINNLNFSTLRPISSSLFYDIVKDTYCIYTKASISKLRTIITKDNIIKLDNIDKTITSIDPSLRTIAIGMREISSNQIEKLKKMNQIEKDLYVLEFECELQLIGILGIQDKLIDNISSTIQWLLYNNISIGILTGDRKVTAIAIAKQCGLISEDIKIITLDNVDSLRNIYIYKTELVDSETLIVFNNYFLIEVTSSVHSKNMLFEILKYKPLLLGYALTPSGKKIIVDLLETINIKTLTIGDGYNDIPMIQTANIGVSVSDSIQTKSDCHIDNFNGLVDVFRYGYQFSKRNQIIALYTVYKSCSIGFILSWYLLYALSDKALFTFVIFQGFNLLWCIIHPMDYTLSIEKGLNKDIIKNTKNILNPYSMLFWILIAAFHSTVLFITLNHLMTTTSIVTFMIIYQVNCMLFSFDISYRSIFYQCINTIFYMFYLVFFDIGIKSFLDIYLLNTRPILVYKSIVLISHLIISLYYQKKILCNNKVKYLKQIQ